MVKSDLKYRLCPIIADVAKAYTASWQVILQEVKDGEIFKTSVDMPVADPAHLSHKRGSHLFNRTRCAKETRS